MSEGKAMRLSPQITFRNMSPSEAMERNILERIEKLDSFYDGIMSCRVMIEASHKHHHQGNVYHVRIDLTVPGHELAVSRDPGRDHAHEDAYVAIRDAFDAARRQLEDLERRQRSQVKTHEVQAHGPDFPADSGGRLRHHRDAGRPGNLFSPAQRVRFAEEMGEEGPQASSVRVEGKHHLIG
ncbi:hypothetical protein [Plasmodium yoelii yoelii]|uniref:Uncharacterized protein n=1 Tax=Plasmodium yoelii yoelii TaxID=73239 RepID=Q7R6X5_PLAYO|nr:hypothetical protein [Plasmodium yoelii yoelii]